MDQLEQELSRERYKHRYSAALRSTVYSLMVVASFAILIATLVMPVLKVYGSSMDPTLQEGQIIVAVKSTQLSRGDLVAFYFGNKLLVKRCIAGPGDWVDIDESGTVSVNGEVLDEPYVADKALGQCDLEFPYQVPESRYFLLGDHRTTSVDSRSSLVGCVSEEQIIGRVVFSIWPLSKFGTVN